MQLKLVCQSEDEATSLHSLFFSQALLLVQMCRLVQSQSGKQVAFQAMANEKEKTKATPPESLVGRSRCKRKKRRKEQVLHTTSTSTMPLKSDLVSDLLRYWVALATTILHETRTKQTGKKISKNCLFSQPFAMLVHHQKGRRRRRRTTTTTTTTRQ